MKQNQIANYKDESQTLFDIVVDYTYALNTLDNYDYQRLTISDTTLEGQFHATYENAMEAIQSLREKFGGCAISLVALLSLVTRKMILSRAVLVRSIRRLGAKNSIPVSRKRLLCCSTS